MKRWSRVFTSHCSSCSGSSQNEWYGATRKQFWFSSNCTTAVAFWLDEVVRRTTSARSAVLQTNAPTRLNRRRQCMTQSSSRGACADQGDRLVQKCGPGSRAVADYGRPHILTAVDPEWAVKCFVPTVPQAAAAA